jgi:AsmA protein
MGVVVWFATGAAIDAGRLKGELESGVQRATGRAFTIAGKLHVTMGLAPRITAEGISLANVTGGSQPAMLTARSLAAQVALLPLLTGQVVLEDVTLDGVDILVEPGPDGRLNWQFQPQRHALVQSSESGSSGGGGESLDVHRVHLQSGRVTWRGASGRGVTVGLDDAVLTTPSADSPITGTGHGQAYDVPISFTVSTGSFSRLQGGPVTALAGWWLMKIELAAGPATLKLDGTISHPDEGRGYQFTLTANAPDLTPLATWLPPALALPMHDVNLTARMSDGSNGTFRTSSLSLHAGAADLGAAVPGLVLKEAVFSAPGPGQQAQLNVDGTYQGAPLRLAGTTTQPDVLAGDIPLPVTFSAAAGSATLSARGTIPPSTSANGFDLTVDVRAPNLADLSSLARRPLPDVKNLVFGAHIGDAGFRLRGLDMRDIALQSSIGDAAGNLTVAWAPVVTLNGTLTSRQFDLDAALAGWSMIAAPQAPAPGAPPSAAPVAAPPGRLASTTIPDAPLPFASLHGADGDLTLTLDHMTMAGEAYRDVSLKMAATGGRVVVNPLRMTAPQGILIGGLTVDASADPPQVALTFRSPGLSAAKVSDLLGYPGGARGALQVDAQLSSAGASPHALAAALDGHLGLSLVNGTVSDDLLQTMLGSALSRAGVPAFGGDVAVRCFAARTDFAHGIGRVRTLALDTPQMAMGGDGDVDLGGETVALHLRPVVRLGGTGVAAPVSLTGGFGDLKAALDPVLGGGRVGISIGGPAPSGEACASKLALARGGMPGPMPAVSRAPSNSPIKKPVDLLRGLFH